MSPPWLPRQSKISGCGRRHGWATGGPSSGAAAGDFSEFFRRYVSGLDELPYDAMLIAAGLKLEAALRRAVVAAALAVTKAGAREGMPTTQELKRAASRARPSA